MRTIQLKSSDDQMIEVSEAVAMQSGAIKNFLKESSNAEGIVTVMPVPVSAEMLKKVIEWMKENQSWEEDEEIEDREDNFVDMDVIVLQNLAVAAHYLDVNALLYRCCEKIADAISGKSVEEVRHILGIVNDFTPEEEEEIREQNAWT